MTELAVSYPEPSELERRALNQAAREILLSQSNDWPFIITAGTMDNYARGRLKNHMIRFNRLHRQITTGNIDPT